MLKPAHKKSKELTGRHILLSVIAFFAVLFLVNGAFIYAAVTSFRGEDVERSYRQGLDYDQTLEARREQANLGWTVTVDVAAENEELKPTFQEIKIRVMDANGVVIPNVKITGRLRHPVDRSRDVTLTFDVDDPATSRFPSESGRWSFEGEAQKNDMRFAFRKDFVLK